VNTTHKMARAQLGILIRVLGIGEPFWRSMKDRKEKQATGESL